MHNRCFNIFMFGLAALILFTASLPAVAQAAEPRWTIPFVGFMSAPQGFTALDIEDWANQIDKITERGKKRPAINPLYNPFTPPTQLKFYQLSLNDGKAYHQAYAMVFRDEKDAIPQLKALTEGTPSAKDAAIQAANKEINKFIQFAKAEADKTEVLSFDVLNLNSITIMKDTPVPIVSMSGRLIVNSKGLIFPVFAKSYLLDQNGKPVLIIIATSDSDAQGWNKLTDDMVRSLTKYHVSPLLKQ